MPRDDEQQRDTRVDQDIAQGLELVVAGTIRNGDRRCIEYVNKSGRIPAWAHILMPLAVATADTYEGGECDETSAQIVDLFRLGQGRQLFRCAVERTQLCLGCNHIAHIIHTLARPDGPPPA